MLGEETARDGRHGEDLHAEEDDRMLRLTIVEEIGGGEDGGVEVCELKTCGRANAS